MTRIDLKLLHGKKTVRGITTTLYWRLGNLVIRRRRNRNVSGKKWKRTPVSSPADVRSTRLSSRENPDSFKKEVRMKNCIKEKTDISVGSTCLAPQVGLEPTTYGLTVRRSNQLSY